METIILWLQPIKNISVIKTLVKKIERVDFREENNFRGDLKHCRGVYLVFINKSNYIY